MQIQPLAPQLPDAQLQLRQSLPLKPSPARLIGRFVRLEPFDMARDAATLYAISNGQPVTLGSNSVGEYDADALIWRFLFMGPFATLADFQSYMQRQLDAPTASPSPSLTRPPIIRWACSI